MTAFQTFVVFAAMRTGSNLLEEWLSAIPGVQCLGEAFNPVFIGFPDREMLLGIPKAARDAKPQALLDRIFSEAPLTGFRYFPDHDPRVLEAILANDRCAKIILNRNPAESYVSLKIARETGQWRLRDGRRRKEAAVTFDAQEFAAHLDLLGGFQRTVLHALQTSGQTAFYLDYEDLGDEKVLAGLARFLGVAAPPKPPRTILPQNPDPLADKVTNPADMAQAFAALDPFGLARVPNFEPRRGPGYGAFVAAGAAPLMFLPMPGGPTDAVTQWLADFGAAVQQGFSPLTARDWMAAHAPHRRFTVLRHPVLRAWIAFTNFRAKAQAPGIAAQVARRYKISADAGDDPAALRAGFVGFLKFLRLAVAGQSPVRAEPAWSSQWSSLQGFARFAAPDHLLREDSLADDLTLMCKGLGLTAPAWRGSDADARATLAQIHDPEIGQLARRAYAQDYAAFGFGDWPHAA